MIVSYGKCDNSLYHHLMVYCYSGKLVKMIVSYGKCDYSLMYRHLMVYCYSGKLVK